jgi:hypothetical protein
VIKVAREHYNLSIWITRILLAVLGTLSSLFLIDATLSEWAAIVSIKKAAWIYLLFGVAYAAVTEFVARLFVYLSLRLSKVYTIPRRELNLFALMAVALRFAILSLLNNLYFITPVITVFGGVLFGFIASLVAFLLLWTVINRLYLNDKNAPLLFKSYAVVFVVILLFGGGIDTMFGLGGLFL